MKRVRYSRRENCSLVGWLGLGVRVSTSFCSHLQKRSDYHCVFVSHNDKESENVILHPHPERGVGIITAGQHRTLQYSTGHHRTTARQPQDTAEGGGKVRGARCEVVKCEVPVRGKL